MLGILIRRKHLFTHFIFHIFAFLFLFFFFCLFVCFIYFLVREFLKSSLERVPSIKKLRTFIVNLVSIKEDGNGVYKGDLVHMCV